jgi:hypothetical protein
MAVLLLPVSQVEAPDLASLVLAACVDGLFPTLVAADFFVGAT